MTEAMSYKEAGVDIDAGNELVGRIKKIVGQTHREGVLGSIGGFGGCFSLETFKYRKPVLVSATDGVGTKLRLAIEYNQHDHIGTDLVAMCVNDLVVMGAQPLFFLDYFATGKLHVDTAARVIESIAKGCKIANCALIGGETAEMPGMYAHKDYDLAGFCVGIVEKDEVIDGSTIRAGDSLIALASSGAHSNGYSLIRHIISKQKITLDSARLDALLKPTRIYVQSLLALAHQQYLKGAAHITGGGFMDNIPRILPQGLAARINEKSWQIPELFQWLQHQGQLDHFELFRTFNCGVGMVVCCNKSDESAVLSLLQEKGETAWIIGDVVEKKSDDVVFV